MSLTSLDRPMTSVLVYGSDHLAFRVIEQLREDGSQVSVIAPPHTWLATAIEQLPSDVTRFCVDADIASLLRRADVASLDSLFAVTDKDEENLGIALAALEFNPDLRVVLRQFNVRLGKILADYLPQCEVLSMSALAAPTFAVAALKPNVLYAHTLAEHLLVVHEIGIDERRPDGELMRTSPQMKIIALRERETVHWFPSDERIAADASDARLLVATVTSSQTHADDIPSHPQVERARAAHSRASRFGLRELRRHPVMLATIAYLVFVIAAGALYFNLRLQLSPLDAVYFVVTIITSVGFGDFSLRDADALSKLVGIFMMVSGVGVTAILFAIVTNSLLSKQQAYEQGRMRHSLSGHTIICGLGVVGLRVASVLQSLGQTVLVIERDGDGRFVQEARRQGIKLVIGDALQEQTLSFANLSQARALIVCTNPDHLNLEIALGARSLHPHLPIVLRMFDPALSRRVARHFKIGSTFSSASIAAARFAAHASGSNRLFDIEYDGSTLEIHRVTPLENESIEICCRRHNGKLIAIEETTGRVRLVDDFSSRLISGERLIMAIVFTAQPHSQKDSRS